MGEYVRVLFQVIGGGAVAVGAVYFLSKKLLSHLLEKDLEKFKSNLELSTTLELEKIKHQNETVITEYKEKVSLLSINRFEAIKIISQRLIDLWASIEQATAIMRPMTDDSKSERAKKEVDDIVEKLNELLSDFKKYEIFFPNDFSESLLDFRSKLETRVVIYGGSVIRSYSEDTYNQAYTNFCENVNPAVQKIKELRKTLRQLIGVE